MKKLNILIITALCLFAVTSCNDGDRIELGNESSYIEPVLTQTIPQNFVIDIDTDLTEAIGTWTWTKADYGVQSPVLYTLEMSLDENFEDPQILTTTNSTTIEATYDLLNKAALEYKTESSPITLYLRLKSNLGTAGKGPVFYSETKSIAFTCYVAYPKEVYMIGGDFGNWTWSAAGIVSMVPVNGKPGEFWCVRYFNANNGFKWAPVKEWKGDFNSLGTNVGYTISDGNAMVATSGFYSVYIDYPNKKITIEPAQVYGIGDTFGGWESGKYPFKANGTVMELTSTGSGELRIYANSSASSIGGDWWRMEFVILNGKIAYRANGGDQDRVQVKAGEKITLDFNAGTGTIK